MLAENWGGDLFRIQQETTLKKKTFGLIISFFKQVALWYFYQPIIEMVAWKETSPLGD